MESSSSRDFPCRDTSSFALIDLPQAEECTGPIVTSTPDIISETEITCCSSNRRGVMLQRKLRTSIKRLTSPNDEGERSDSNSNCPSLIEAFQNNCNHKQSANLDIEDKDHLPPELHAICLLALFHVNFVCAICNEALIDCICLECGHNFCALCLQQWLTFNRVCPTCYQLVKEDFGGQRTYCVDEFVAEMYTSIQELTQEYFGNSLKHDPPNPPELHPSASEIQTSVHNTRILNPTPFLYRQHLKSLRRSFMQVKHPPPERNEFSLLEQQTELFGGPNSLTLSTVVQFFLSSITAYITYEGGDGIDNDIILVGAISLLVWCTAFLTLMRLLGYDGTFSDLMTYLTFVQLVEETNPPEQEEVHEENIPLSSDDSDLHTTSNLNRTTNASLGNANPLSSSLIRFY